MPLSTRRSFTRRTRRGWLGSIGLIAVHSSSLRPIPLRNSGASMSGANPLRPNKVWAKITTYHETITAIERIGRYLNSKPGRAKITKTPSALERRRSAGSGVSLPPEEIGALYFSVYFIRSVPAQHGRRARRPSFQSATSAVIACIKIGTGPWP
jgi:hypothetical protein